EQLLRAIGRNELGELRGGGRGRGGSIAFVALVDAAAVEGGLEVEGRSGVAGIDRRGGGEKVEVVVGHGAGCSRDLAEGRTADDLLGRAGAGKLEDNLRVVQRLDPVILYGVPAGG